MEMSFLNWKNKCPYYCYNYLEIYATYPIKEKIRENIVKVLFSNSNEHF